MRISNALLISLCMILYGFFGAGCSDRYCDLENPDRVSGVPLEVATQENEVEDRSIIKTNFVPGDKMGLFLVKKDTTSTVTDNLLSTFTAIIAGNRIICYRKRN